MKLGTTLYFYLTVRSLCFASLTDTNYHTSDKTFILNNPPLQPLQLNHQLTLRFHFNIPTHDCSTHIDRNTMSLKSLPTELDIKIIEVLCLTNDQKALSALSRTSKYYHKLVEPMLYRDLTFQAVDSIQIKRLFLTLLVREDLPQHIRSFILSDSPLVNPDGGWDVLGPGDLADDLLKHDNLTLMFICSYFKQVRIPYRARGVPGFSHFTQSTKKQ
jgi:hypothetical protein